MPDRIENLFTSLQLYDERFLDDPGNWHVSSNGGEITITFRAYEDVKCRLMIYEHDGKFRAYAYYDVPFSGFSPRTRFSAGGREFSGTYEVTDWNHNLTDAENGEIVQKDGEDMFEFVERCIIAFEEDVPDEDAVPEHVRYPEPDEDYDEDERLDYDD